MSHFSKIKTNISDLDILKQTLSDFGLFYSLNISSEYDVYLNVYNNQYSNRLLCTFEYDGSTYSLVADMQLWNFSTQFDNFYEKLKQKYACNVVLQQSNFNGFSKVSEKVMEDGSISVLVQRWL